MTIKSLFIKSKLKAFTIIELSVVALLGSFLLFMAYFALEIITKRYFISKKQQDKYVELDYFLHRIEKDMLLSNETLFDGYKIVFFYDKREAKHTYEIEKEYVLYEHQESLDTFHIKLENIEYYFDKKNVKTGTIDEIEGFILMNKEKIPFHFFKKYDYLRLFQNEENNEWTQNR